MMNDFLSVYKKINGNTMKVIACVVMLIDHIAHGIIIPVVREGLYPDNISFEQIEFVYDLMRAVGRNSFPVFCFLLAEGFLHTSSRPRYALGLLIFGFLSEPFYDVVLFPKADFFNLNFFEAMAANRPYLNDQCNVYFTLLLGLLAIWAIEKIFTLELRFEFRAAAAVISSAAFIFIAERIHSDYHGIGVGVIIAFYLLRSLEPANLIAGYGIICLIESEYASLPSFLLMLLYNKERGRKLGKLKYLFYAYYPMHLLVIYLVRCLLYG